VLALPLLDATIKESVAPAPDFPRRAPHLLRPMRLCDYDLPAGMSWFRPILPGAATGDAFAEAGSRFLPDDFLSQRPHGVRSTCPLARHLQSTSILLSKGVAASDYYSRSAGAKIEAGLAAVVGARGACKRVPAPALRTVKRLHLDGALGRRAGVAGFARRRTAQRCAAAEPRPSIFRPSGRAIAAAIAQA